MNLTHRDRRFISKARMLAQQAKSFTQGLYVWWTDVAKYLRPAYSQEKPPQYPIALIPHLSPNACWCSIVISPCMDMILADSTK